MAVLHPFFLDTVVALGAPNEDRTINYTATGFLYGYPSGEFDSEGKQQYWIFLVTNRHVYDGAISRREPIHVRFNQVAGTSAKVYPFALQDDEGRDLWIVHPNDDIDVAVSLINVGSLIPDEINYSFVESDNHSAKLDESYREDINEGDGVFVIGFPMGLAGEERNYVIVRQGIVARSQDWQKGISDTFLIDASIFPGNSGGPVFRRPELQGFTGRQNNQCLLIGMVSSYMPYQEFAISEQTGRRRMMFEENWGLGVVVPHDNIYDTVKLAVERFGLTP